MNSKTVIGDAALFHAPMEEVIGELGHVNHIFTDPPCLCLKQDFDKPFEMDKKGLTRADLRAVTPEGFARAFFKANP